MDHKGAFCHITLKAIYKCVLIQLLYASFQFLHKKSCVKMLEAHKKWWHTAKKNLFRLGLSGKDGVSLQTKMWKCVSEWIVTTRSIWLKCCYRLHWRDDQQSVTSLTLIHETNQNDIFSTWSSEVWPALFWAFFFFFSDWMASNRGIGANDCLSWCTQVLVIALWVDVA